MCAKKALSNKRGQAVLEYVLISFVAITIFVGLVYKFNSAFKVWADKYFVGEESVLFCLIANGILPGQTEGICDPAEFSLASGKDLKKVGSPGLSASSSGGANAGRAGGDGASGDSSGKNSGEGGKTAKDRSGGGLASAGPGFGSGFGSSSKGRGGRSGGGGPGGGEEKKYTGSDKVSTVSPGSDGLNTKDLFAGGGGYGASRGLQSADTSERGGQKIVPTNKADFKSREQLILERKKARELANTEEQNWSIGRFLKFFIILALLFAIIFFVGSQINSVARGRRRN